MTKTKKNFIYNALYQAFSIIVPIILAPYLSRNLGVNSNGIYAYTYSIVYYFMLFVMLGVNNYGSRLIAKKRNNKEEMSKSFFEIYTIQFALGILVSIAYALFIIFAGGEYRNIYIIHSLFILSAIFDINWLYNGLEEFKFTVSRSFLIRTISLISIFLFVKSPNDTWIYTLIMAGSAFVNQIFLWCFLRKRITKVKIKPIDLKKHIKPLVVLFIPVIAVSLYKIMDKIMLGAIADTYEVGVYEYAEKINSIPLTIISALGAVMLPKISNISNDEKKVQQYLSVSSRFVLFISIPMIGLFYLIMPILVPIYLGDEYVKSSILTILLSITLPFISFASVIRTQYLIPKEKDKPYIISVILGAIINLVMNLTLIPNYGSIGACIGTICAEISVMAYQSFAVRKNIAIKKYALIFAEYIIKSVPCFIASYLISMLNIPNIPKILAETIVFAICYIILNWKYVKENLNLKLIFKKG